MNVQAPSIEDVANSLPASWRGTVTQRSHTRDGSHPGNTWVESFWRMVSSQLWDHLPASLDDILLVPLTGNQLASPIHCKTRHALTCAHLREATSIQPDAAELLSQLGCLCISELWADLVSILPASTEPVTHALRAAASRRSTALHAQISEQHLGKANYSSVCQILTNIQNPDHQQQVEAFLRQCIVFEDLSGRRVKLASMCNAKLLPDEAWECSMASMQDLLPWTIIRYHKASTTQQQLLDSAGFRCTDTCTFLSKDLLPTVYSSANSKLEPLLLQACDSLASYSSLKLPEGLQVFVNGQLRPVDTLVDSSSPLMKALFARGNCSPDYTLLPAEYAQGNRLSTLYAHGLAHENMPSESFFLACAKQLILLYKGQDRSRVMIKHSTMLLDMLKRNVKAYLSIYMISNQPVLVRASVVSPYDSPAGPPLVSLQDSEDYDHFRVVASTVAVTDPAMGDTTQLRADLGLPSGPQPLHVVDHLLQTAKAQNSQLQSQPGLAAMSKHVQEDVHTAYGIIFKVVSQSLGNPGRQDKLAELTEKLKNAAWVLIPNIQRFVAPTDLVFDVEEDLEGGQCS